MAKAEQVPRLLSEGGLMEKVDVLAEIPYVIRKGLAAVTGTKPYIYQVRLFHDKCHPSLTGSAVSQSRQTRCDSRQ